ncbi:hypothetical protein QVD17_07539 [Tagetes erecta]|uniref:Uncharacterized protein n=1 Tax=Tagetes erecta TaxID=13708 RepID=A0AAD8LLB6_TARER|nr:hypothetical protein QVD17_07539 [Tagetes erecta]
MRGGRGGGVTTVGGVHIFFHEIQTFTFEILVDKGMKMYFKVKAIIIIIIIIIIVIIIIIEQKFKLHYQNYVKHIEDLRHNPFPNSHSIKT